MKLLKELFEKQHQIYDYFGVEKNWQVYPFDDCTKSVWFIANDSVYFADNLKDFDNENYYDCSFYGSSYDKCVYEKDDYTMILGYTQTNGNLFFSIYDNSKKLKEPDINRLSEYLL